MKIQEQQNIQKIQKIEDPQFSVAYCMKPGFRYAALKSYCRRIEFVTDGFETDIDLISQQIAESMKNFNPDTDCIVPTGTGIINLLVGYFISSKFPDSSLAVAFFQKEVAKFNKVIIPEHYEFYRFNPVFTMTLRR